MPHKTNKLSDFTALSKNTFPETLGDLDDSRFKIPRTEGMVANDEHNGFIEVEREDSRHAWAKLVSLSKKRKYESSFALADLLTNYVHNNVFHLSKSVDYQLKADLKKQTISALSSQVYGKLGALDYVEQKDKTNYGSSDSESDNDDSESDSEKSISIRRPNIKAMLNAKDSDSDSNKSDNENKSNTSSEFSEDLGSAFERRGVEEHKKLYSNFKETQDVNSLIRNHHIYKNILNGGDLQNANMQWYKQNGYHRFYQFDGSMMPLDNNKFMSELEGDDWLEEHSQDYDFEEFGQLIGEEFTKYKKKHGINESVKLTNKYELGSMVTLVALQKLVSRKKDYLKTLENFKNQPDFANLEEQIKELSALYPANGKKVKLSDMSGVLETLHERLIMLSETIERNTAEWNNTHPREYRIPTYEQQTQAKHECNNTKQTNATTTDITLDAGDSTDAVQIAQEIANRIIEASINKAQESEYEPPHKRIRK